MLLLLQLDAYRGNQYEKLPLLIFFFSSRRRHTRCLSDRSSDVCSSDLYARAWSALDDALPPRDACRTMVGLLVLASIREACEIALAARLDAILAARRLPDLAELETEFATRTSQSSEVKIPAPNLDDYNRLLPSAWEQRL